MVASSYTFSYFSNQRWVICNFSIKIHLDFILTSRFPSIFPYIIFLVIIVFAIAGVGCFSSLITRSRRLLAIPFILKILLSNHYVKGSMQSTMGGKNLSQTIPCPQEVYSQAKEMT